MEMLVRLRLEEILANARLAKQFLDGVDKQQFASDIGRIYQVAFAIGIVGEAAAQLSVVERAAINSIPWRQMIDMRNRLIHGYQTLRPDIMFETVNGDFPPLIAELERILNEGPTNGR